MLVLLFYLQLRRVRTQSITCKSAGLCLETDGPCKPDDPETCFPPSFLPLPKPKQVSHEPFGERAADIEPSFRQLCGSPSFNRSDIVLQGLELDYASINPFSLTMCMSWNVTPSSGSYGGFEVRLLGRSSRLLYRYCVRNPSQAKMCISSFKYRDIRHYKVVEVLPYPLAPDDSEEVFKKSVEVRKDIRGCYDVKHKGTICNVGEYGPPENLTVLSSKQGTFTKKLSISWDNPQVQYGTPLPEVYFVSVFYMDQTFSRHFRVENAQQVVIQNLSASLVHFAQVEVYQHCSGLGFYDSNTLGCGLATREVKETEVKVKKKEVSSIPQDLLVSHVGSTYQNSGTISQTGCLGWYHALLMIPMFGLEMTWHRGPYWMKKF